MGRACNICGAAVAHEIVDEYPAEVIARAAVLKLTVEEHAKANMAHCSYKVVKFAPHDGRCGLPCSGAYTPEARRTLRRGSVHDGMGCPCVPAEAPEG